MAIAIRSSSSTSFSTGDLVITKPTGLTAGDLMVVIIQQQNTGGFSALTGWTRIIQKVHSNATCRITIDWKIADASDVASSSFTWTNIEGDEVTGAIIAFTGHSSSSPISIYNSDGTPTSTSTPSFAITVTPSTADSFLIYSIACYSNANTCTASTYAVTTNDPTWTETYDNTVNNGGNRFQGSTATAPRTQTTATGNATVTLSASMDEIVGAMVVVNPAGATVNNGLIELL